MKYTKKIIQKNNDDNNDNNNKLYLFSELTKPIFTEKNMISKYNSYIKKDYILNNKIINYGYFETNPNLTDKNTIPNLLKEISELRKKISKYKNELERAKRVKHIQKIYINLLEQKYISKLISNKENINYENFKSNNLFKTKKKSYQNTNNTSEINYNNLNNESKINFIYKEICSKYRIKQRNNLQKNKHDFSYMNFKTNLKKK